MCTGTSFRTHCSFSWLKNAPRVIPMNAASRKLFPRWIFSGSFTVPLWSPLWQVSHKVTRLSSASPLVFRLSIWWTFKAEAFDFPWQHWHSCPSRNSTYYQTFQTPSIHFFLLCRGREADIPAPCIDTKTHRLGIRRASYSNRIVNGQRFTTVAILFFNRIRVFALFPVGISGCLSLLNI